MSDLNDEDNNSEKDSNQGSSPIKRAKLFHDKDDIKSFSTDAEDDIEEFHSDEEEAARPDDLEEDAPDNVRTLDPTEIAAAKSVEELKKAKSPRLPNNKIKIEAFYGGHHYVFIESDEHNDGFCNTLREGWKQSLPEVIKGMGIVQYGIRKKKDTDGILRNSVASPQKNSVTTTKNQSAGVSIFNNQHKPPMHFGRVVFIAASTHKGLTSPKIRAELAYKIADFCNNESRRTDIQNGVNPDKIKRSKFVVPKDFDLTPKDPKNYRKLNEVLHYRHVADTVDALYRNVDHSWAIRNPKLAAGLIKLPCHTWIQNHLGIKKHPYYAIED